MMCWAGTDGGKPERQSRLLTIQPSHAGLMRTVLFSSLSGLALMLAPALAASNPAGPDPVTLAERLSEAKVVYYGSWRCPACQAQTRLFGEEAAPSLPYVECAKPKELPDQAEACIAAGIRAYPTWILPSGERREGVQSLEELEIWISQPSQP